MNQFSARAIASSAGLQATVQDATFTLPDVAGVADGQDVVVGIRPEHISLNPIEGTAAIPISLDLVEPLGSEALLHASIGEHPMIIKAETHGDIEHLSGVSEIYAPPQLVSVFDAKTGAALTGQHG